MVLHSLLVVACGGNPPDKSVEVNEDVRVLEASSRERLTSFSLDHGTGGGELRFQAGDRAVDGLEAGQILASEPVGTLAPQGFLQRIESRREEGGAIVFTTRQATLEETFDRADIVHTRQLLPADVTASQLRHPGITLHASSERPTADASTGFDFSVGFDQVLIDLDGDEESLDDQLRLDGTFDFSAGIEAKIKIGTEYLIVPTLEHLRFVATMKEAVDLKITGNLSRSFEEEIEVARYFFGAITVPVGPVPVVFAIELRLTVGAKGQLQARLLATAAQSLEITVGAEYRKDDGWKNLSDLESNFDFPKPEISASGSARAFAKPALGLKIYGLSGAFASAAAFIEVDAELDRDPFWNLRAGVDVGAGFKADLPVIGTVVDWSDEHELFRKHLDSSSNEAPIIEVLSPVDAIQFEEGEELRFVVRAMDREQASLPVVVKTAGQQVGAATVERGEPATISAGRPCPGSHQYEISSQDAKGATTKKLVTVVVTNRTPTVTVREDLLTGPFTPGSLLVAFASALDVTCASETNAANQGLISWFVGGVQVPHSGGTLIHVIPAGTQVGTTLTVQARYDDGAATGASPEVPILLTEGVPGANQAPLVFIRAPKHGDGLFPHVAYPLDAFAYDAEDGALTQSALAWSIRRANHANWLPLAPGATSIQLNVFFPDWSTHDSFELRLVATDSMGVSGEHIITFDVVVPG